MNFFRKKSPVTIDVPKADPSQINPQSTKDYIQRGYAYHARAEYQKADEDFRAAISMDAESSEGYYALGLNLKALKRKDDAIQAFQRALDLMNKLEEQDVVRAHMLTRITKGHINQLSKGDWDLRKEFWGAGE